LIEQEPGRYDWSSLRQQLQGAVRADVQVIWDLCHYGWPIGLDIWSNDFVDRFARYAVAAVEVISGESGGPVIVCPINEISYWAWAGGEAALMNPAVRGRAPELKRQLARASIAGMRAIKSAGFDVRFIAAEPLINVAARSKKQQRVAQRFHASQYEACDMLAGMMDPDAGGEPECLDIIGLNYYPANQWYYGGCTIGLGHHAYRPLSDLIVEAYQRYGRPVLIAETGAEGSAKPAWLHYVGTEVREAMGLGVPVLGICWYPVLDYPGWENDRCCSTGLLSVPCQGGQRTLHKPLAAELARQQAIMRKHLQLKAILRAGTE
jgi:beta-glucosidase/6-phospho-beta-glucosidase/beta-galactosidase